jgi:hypothetical protein
MRRIPAGVRQARIVSALAGAPPRATTPDNPRAADRVRSFIFILLCG